MTEYDDKTNVDFVPVTKDLKRIFGRYEITLKVDSSGKFLDIIEVKVGKNFLSHDQLKETASVHDVDEYYKEEVE